MVTSIVVMGLLLCGAGGLPTAGVRVLVFPRDVRNDRTMFDGGGLPAGRARAPRGTPAPARRGGAAARRADPHGAHRDARAATVGGVEVVAPRPCRLHAHRRADRFLCRDRG